MLARQPRDGLTLIAERCQDASGTPSRGEIRNRSANVVTDGGRSATTSSNRNTTSFGFTPTLHQPVDPRPADRESGGDLVRIAAGIPRPHHPLAQTFLEALPQFEQARLDGLVGPVFGR